MPAAVKTKSTMNGTKRKGGPVKEAHVKNNKKAKIDSGLKPAPKKEKVKVKAPIQKIKQLSLDESSDSDSDGGVPLEESEPTGDSDSEVIPTAGDGVHPERAKAVALNSQSSKEAHAKQKQLANERKAAKPLADSLARTKKIWERLRRKSHVPLDERKALVEELFDLITGRMKDFVLKHDSVRVVQTAIKYANPEQKRLIAKELSGDYRQLAESKYAKFLIGKLLVQGDDVIRDLIVPEFFGHVRRLIKHPEASWILDDVYRGVATKQQKARILREWYGAEFAIFDKDASKAMPGDLSEILLSDPGKRAPIMRYLQELINHLIQKKLTGFTLLHDAMLQYFLNAKQGTEEITDYIELLKGDEEGDLLKNLAFTKSGSRVVSLALAYGNAKDRKTILKAYKDTLQIMAADQHAHIIILTAYEVIDDTVSTAKSIFPELFSKDAEKQIENIVSAANDIYARTTLLYLFQGKSKALFPASLSSDLTVLTEIENARTTTSKKDPEIRRRELTKSISPYLLKAIAAAASDLATTSFGCQFITEALFGTEGDKTEALAAVAETASGDPSFVAPPAAPPVVVVADAEYLNFEDEPTGTSHIGSTPFGGRMLKSLIAGGHYDMKTQEVIFVTPPLNFAEVLYPHIKDHIIGWATGSSSFVVLALLETKFESKEEVLQLLKQNKKELKKAATEETVEQKMRKEEEAAATAAVQADIKVGKKGKKAKAPQVRGVGNRGAALLLEKLS